MLAVSAMVCWPFDQVADLNEDAAHQETDDGKLADIDSQEGAQTNSTTTRMPEVTKSSAAENCVRISIDVVDRAPIVLGIDDLPAEQRTVRAHGADRLDALQPFEQSDVIDTDASGIVRAERETGAAKVDRSVSTLKPPSATASKVSFQNEKRGAEDK